MRELSVLLNIGVSQITSYSLLLALAVTLGVVLTVLLSARNTDRALGLSIAVIIGGLLGAKIVYCLTMLETILVDIGADFLYQWWRGGYNLYGAVLGGLAGAAVYARAHHAKVNQCFALAAPGSALALAVARFAEALTDQGMGHYLDAELGFPFAVADMWGDLRLPVFFYEGIAALVICFVTSRLLRKEKYTRCAECFIILLGVTQILLENMREDDFIRFGFVRFNQIAAAVTLAAVLVLSIRRQLKSGSGRPWQIARAVIFVVTVVLVILIEFALDKTTIDNVLLYVIMTGVICLMGFALLHEGRKRA